MENLRRTFPKKTQAGTPRKSPVETFKRDREIWSNERNKVIKKPTRYFDNDTSKEDIIAERRAKKKKDKEEKRLLKVELKKTKKQLNEEKKKDREDKMKKIKKINGGIQKKTKKKMKAVPVEEEEEDDDDDMEREGGDGFDVPRDDPRFNDSDVDSDDIPGDDMFGNEKSDDSDNDDDEEKKRDGEEEEEEDEEEEDEEEEEVETVPLTSSQSMKRSKIIENNEDEEMEGYEDGEEEEEEDDDDEEEGPTDLDKFRQEMASLPLSKVREMKEKLGIKLFNDAFFGRVEKAVDEDKMNDNKKIKTFKRDNAKRPREVSSKKVSSKFRPIYTISTKNNKFDPRFEERCGEFNETIHDANYDFLNDIRQSEIKEMKKEVMKCKKNGDIGRVEELRQEIRREENRERSKREKDMRIETMRELKKENLERMKQGLKPKFIKRSEVKMRIMTKKFDQLKEDKQLDKYLRRKAKNESRKGYDGVVGPTLGI